MSECKVATGGQITMLYNGLYLVALGTGGIKVALPVLGLISLMKKIPRRHLNYQAFSTGSYSVIGALSYAP